MKWIHVLAIIALSMSLSACAVLDYFTIAEVETVPSEQVPTGAGETPPDLYYVLGDSISLTDRGTYCWSSGEFGMCVDMIPPSYEENQHNLFPSDTIEFLFYDPVPDSVSVGLHPGSSMMTRAADIQVEDVQLEADGRLIVTIPEQLDGHYILYVFAVWDDYGDAMYTTPILLE